MIDDNAAARFPVGKRFGNWVVIKRIDEGGFGQVYKVENIVTKKFAALKAESNDIEGGSALKLEMNVMRAIAADGEKPHVPIVFHAAKRRRFCYMIMTLLGENLKELKLSCPKEYMTARTWTRIAIQCLYSVKVVHDYGFVHRDIKPNNFVMGHREDYERARIVHILDFGLSRSYAIQSKDGKWVARRARGTAEFRGTLRYCSPNVHEKKEQGRRDDLWSLFYVFIELHCGLPWQTLRDKQKVEILKMNISDKDLVLNFPAELHGVIPHLRTLNYYQRPDYTMFYEGLLAVMKRVGAKASDPYDWEKPETVKNIQKRLKGPYPWENASEFFKNDPIKVNSAPPPKRKRQELMKAFKPLDEEVNKSSDHTTASTDLEKRADIPTEQTMNDMDKKMFEVFGIKKTENEKLHDLGIRFSGEILKNMDLDESGNKDGKGDKKKEAKKAEEEVKAKGDAKIKKDNKEVKKTGEEPKSKDDAKVKKDKKEAKSKEDVKVKLKKEDKVDEAKRKEAPPRAKLSKEKAVAKSKETTKTKSKEQTTTPSKETVEANVKKKAAEGKAKPVVKEGAAEKKKEKTASKEEVKKKEEKKVSKEEVQKKDEKKASKEDAQKKEETAEKKEEKVEKKEEKEDKKAEEEKKTPSTEKAASKEKQDSGGRNGKEKREKGTDDTPRATKSGSNPGSQQQAVDHKE